jgi:hypothetical protein
MSDAAAAMPPAQRLSQMIISLWVPQAIHAAAQLGVADLIGDGAVASSMVAERLGTHPDATARLLRALQTLGLLEQRSDTFALTDLGQCLRSDASASRRAWSQLMGGPFVWDSWGRLADCVRTGRKASSLDDSEGGKASASAHFEALDADPAAAAIFHQAMADLTRGVAPGIVGAVDWRGVRRVVDVGGGYGALLCAVLRGHAALEGAVFDLESAREGALAAFAAQGLGARASYVVGSVFEQTPPSADVYLLKSVIHDWDDTLSVRVLGACREAMETGSRLLLIEPAHDEAQRKPGLDWILTFSDLNMLVNTGGRERSAAQYHALLEAAGLRATAVREAGFFQVFEAQRV